MSGLAYEPISYLLKDVLNLSAGAAAVFTAWMTAPFALKPVLGLLSDAVPWAGYRRRSYLFASSLLAGASWLALAFRPTYGYASTLALLTAVNVGIAFSDVLCDAVMVRRGRERSKTGSYQAVQIGTLYLCLVVTGLGGGWMAARLAYRSIFALTSVFPLLIAASTFLVEEKTVAPGGGASRALRNLAGGARDPSAWAAAAVILLWNFLPYQGTSFFYYQTEALGFSKTFIGLLSTVSGASGVLGAALFWRFYGRTVVWRGRAVSFDTASLVRWSVLAGAPLTLLFLGYRGPVSALLVTGLLGAAGVAMRLSLMDLAAKLCPPEGEAASFALFMAVFNLAALGSNTLGGWLYDALKGPLSAGGAMSVLIWLGALTTAACWPLLGRLGLETEPRALLEVDRVALEA